MRKSICKCIYRYLIDEPVTWTSIILDFLMSFAIATIGLITNYRFKNKLRKEKKSTLPNRKGNVIEPIMRWYLIFAMVFWPYELLEIMYGYYGNTVMFDLESGSKNVQLFAFGGISMSNQNNIIIHRSVIKV